MQDPTAALYLDLMKKCLTYSIWGETARPICTLTPRPWHKRLALTALARLLAKWKIQLVREAPFNPALRREGGDWPLMADTMIGLERLDNLQASIEDVIRNNVPGDLIETGVWRGGATIFMRAVLKAYGVTDRAVWVADSFEGLPPPNPEKYPADAEEPLNKIAFLRVSLENVKANFAKYGLLDEQVLFLKGWFKDTLPIASIERLAVMRLDGDMYESTMDALINLYPKLSVGGYVIIDDYRFATCRQAVRDFRTANGITDEMKAVDRNAVYWRRGSGAATSDTGNSGVVPTEGGMRFFVSPA